MGLEGFFDCSLPLQPTTQRPNGHIVTSMSRAHCSQKGRGGRAGNGSWSPQRDSTVHKCGIITTTLMSVSQQSEQQIMTGTFQHPNLSFGPVCNASWDHKIAPHFIPPNGFRTIHKFDATLYKLLTYFRCCITAGKRSYRPIRDSKQMPATNCVYSCILVLQT